VGTPPPRGFPRNDAALPRAHQSLWPDHPRPSTTFVSEGSLMGAATTPKKMAQKLVRLLRPERPDYAYLKKAFQHTRELLAVKPARAKKRLPHLLTDQELVAF
jgi:hypothetical protein